jgi:hypothetical protein
MGHRREPHQFGRESGAGLVSGGLPGHVQRAQTVRRRQAVEERESLRQLRDFFDSEFAQPIEDPDPLWADDASTTRRAGAGA